MSIIRVKHTAGQSEEETDEKIHQIAIAPRHNA